MLVMLSVSVDEFLIAHTIELGKLEIRGAGDYDYWRRHSQYVKPGVLGW